MKRIISYLCLIALLVGLCACGAEKEEPTTTAATGPNTVMVTFIEGMTVWQIAKRLEENDVCSAMDFIEAVQTAECAFTVPDAQDRPFRLEGYVFPDTYEFYIGESATSALSRFLKNMQVKWTAENEARAEELGLSMDEILTMASIIQAEAGIVTEMGKVSSVLHNRLEKNMALECDVTYFYLSKTVVPFYCGDDWDDALYEMYADRYYTYRFRGLPLGPICNPSADAIHAALYPDDTMYLYFVTDSDGQYYYSETLAQHQRMCNAIK